MATTVLESGSTEGEIIRNCKSPFSIRVLTGNAGTIPPGTYVQYAFALVNELIVQDTNLEWTRASQDFILDSGIQAAQTQQFLPPRNSVFRVVTNSAGATAGLTAEFAKLHD